MLIYLYTEKFGNKPHIFFDYENMVVRQIFTRTGYAIGIFQGKEFCEDLYSSFYTTIKCKKIISSNEYYIDVAKTIIISKLILEL